MNKNASLKAPDAAEAVRWLKEAAAAKKCWACGCLHGALEAIDRTFAEQDRPPELDAALSNAQSKLTPKKYDCLGCDVCYPSLAINALNIGFEACPTDDVLPREGWPPLAGAYTVLRYCAPVAVCTLTDDALAQAVAEAGRPEIAIVGTMQTENLGIERVVHNILANPNIRFLTICGPDSRQAIGHLPGQSLLALAGHGLDGQARIIDAKGRRPHLHNLDPQAVEHFRKTVEVIDLVGNSDVPTILDQAKRCAARHCGPAEPFFQDRYVALLTGRMPPKMTPDPAGYFVIFVDRQRSLLSMEHYSNDGVLDVVIEGASAAEAYLPVIERGLVSRLDHAAYLGRELARAEEALASGQPYVQDAAPEATLRGDDELIRSVSACGCEDKCHEG